MYSGTESRDHISALYTCLLHALAHFLDITNRSNLKFFFPSSTHSQA
jgi:hypothetical protein